MKCSCLRILKGIILQTKNPFVRRVCAKSTITILLFLTEVLLSPDLHLMCPGVLHVNACTNRENSKVLSDGRMVKVLLPMEFLNVE